LKATVPISQTYYIDTSLASSTTWYYVLTTVENDSKESFYSKEISATTGATITLQAEDGVHGGVVYLDDNHPGFHGTGFVNFDTDNSSVEFTDVPGFGGGEMTLVYRYALGNTSRTGSLIVNGIAKNLTMKTTGEWTTWVLDSTGITLQTGFENTVRFESTGSDFGNLDEITIYPPKITGIELAGNGDSQIPASYQLYQNYPNPFNPETQIQFDLPEATHVRIDIFDLTGRLVTTLTNTDYSAGSYYVIFNGSEIASGMYLARSQMNRLNVSEEAHIFTRKIILLK
jgi:rhamnogalacturonan endolyase